jgi:hypothetical protein
MSLRRDEPPLVQGSGRPVDSPQYRSFSSDSLHECMIILADPEFVSPDFRSQSEDAILKFSLA